MKQLNCWLDGWLDSFRLGSYCTYMLDTSSLGTYCLLFHYLSFFIHILFLFLSPSLDRREGQAASQSVSITYFIFVHSRPFPDRLETERPIQHPTTCPASAVGGSTHQLQYLASYPSSAQGTPRTKRTKDTRSWANWSPTNERSVVGRDKNLAPSPFSTSPICSFSRVFFLSLLLAFFGSFDCYRVVCAVWNLDILIASAR
ncbi:hypothetical protein GGR54DRAFT_487119 [Hypoxylon sp. NC1633]|nr:hypothetical protein GGR54DRAFT_487119 [Hypoxylon sp. NC1633]